MTETRKPIIGIAFGGGGIRGMAHIGVMEALEKAGIKADMVAGTSIGSAMAAFYAMGLSGTFLAKVVMQMDLKSVMSFRPNRSGLIDGRNYAEFVGILTKHKNIEDTNIPLRIVATDLIKWEKVVFDHGPITTAVQASSAIPGAFQPVEVGERLLVDGCLLDNVPDDVLRKMGAEIVISINLDCKIYQRPKHLVDIIQRSMDIMSNAGQRIQDSDIIIKPFKEYVPSLALDKTEFCLECGREVAKEKIGDIQRLIAEWKPKGQEDEVLTRLQEKGWYEKTEGNGHKQENK